MLDQREALDNFLRRSRGASRNIYTQWSAPQSSYSRYVSNGQDAENDRIAGGLPGQPSEAKFAQYSGYVNIDSSTGRALFYYFAEAATNPAGSPLVLWLNGGPGCSSLGFGAMEEIGPFGVNPDGKTLYANPYAWNKLANTLFLEAPAGVGFSYSNTTSDYKSNGDQRTAEDSYTFLVNWFQRFPQYKNRDFYIIGESYAGYYIPELADTILYHKNQSEAAFINLRGIMIGNGLMNTPTDNQGRFDFLWTHALISDEAHEGIQRACNFSSHVSDSVDCLRAEAKAYLERGNINDYNMYAPTCSGNSSSSTFTTVGQNPEYDPCSDDYVSNYLNTPQVQRALHANVTGIGYPWVGCSYDINNAWNDTAWSMLPLYPKLIQEGLRIFIYSGDVDTNVPVTSTKYGISELRLPIESAWYPWVNGHEVGGYSVIYKGLTFATVRGSGHFVPRFQPTRALTVLRFFLAGQPLPSG